MGDTGPIAPLSLVASIDSFEHPAMLFHMLAQLPNDARLTLIGSRRHELPAPLARVADAYGFDGRIHDHVHRRPTRGETS